jgi:glutamate:GABA antiporter
MVLVFAVLANLGVGSQESYQLLNNGAGICYAVTYVVMFAIPLAAPGEKPRWTVRISAVSGLVMTLLYVVLSVFPIIDVENRVAFIAKVMGVIAGSNALGVAFYWGARSRTKHQ